jgi:hypothetical protein
MPLQNVVLLYKIMLAPPSCQAMPRNYAEVNHPVHFPTVENVGSFSGGSLGMVLVRDHDSDMSFVSFDGRPRMVDGKVADQDDLSQHIPLHAPWRC